MGSLLSKPGHCIGKIQEAFAVSSLDEMLEMLAAPGIEGLIYIDRTSVDYAELSAKTVN
jgi:hypothetical protein